MILSGHKILITGSSRGIGKACAEKCACEGARVVLVARNENALEDVRRSLPGNGHISIAADLLDPEACVPDIFKTACADGVKLTGMVHAAGIGLSFPVKTVSMKSMLESFTINYFSFMMLVRHFIQKKNS